MFFPLRVCGEYLQYDNKKHVCVSVCVLQMGRGGRRGHGGVGRGRSLGWRCPYGKGGGGGRTGPSRRSHDLAHRQHGRRSDQRDPHFIYSDIKLKKKKMNKITNKNKREEESRQVGGAGGRGRRAFRPGSCTCPSLRPLAPGTPSRSGCRCIS